MADKGYLWVIDDDRAIRWVLEKALGSAGFLVTTFENGQDALDCLENEQPDAIFSDIRMPGISGLDLLRKVHERHPDLPVVIMTAHSDLDSAVGSYQTGAFDYLPKPFDIDKAVELAHRAVEHAHQQVAEDDLADANVDQVMLGEAPAMQEVFRAIGRLSASNVTVLINGASGTGKELVARALHQHSPRASQPFIALNMAAIPHDLIETELFGHEKGAFTGATTQRKGRFEQANGGTLFLDEIGDMPADTQTRLLRVLSQGEFYRVGGHTPVKVNVRIIAATHQNLENLVRKGRFREDLFHRLNVIRIKLPRLSERKEDVPLLARYFLARAAEEMGENMKTLRPDAVEYLVAYDWPGNVRELENSCRWLTVMAPGAEITPTDLPAEIMDSLGQTAPALEAPTPAKASPSESSRPDVILSSQVTTRSSQPPQTGCWTEGLRQWAEGRLVQGDDQILKRALPLFERVLIDVALRHTHGRRRDAAELLGWGRNTITRKLKDFRVQEADEALNSLVDGR
jgi:two-component system nitrogen regulation response regulator GlnG